MPLESKLLSLSRYSLSLSILSLSNDTLSLERYSLSLDTLSLSLSILSLSLDTLSVSRYSLCLSRYSLSLSILTRYSLSLSRYSLYVYTLALSILSLSLYSLDTLSLSLSILSLSLSRYSLSILSRNSLDTLSLSLSILSLSLSLDPLSLSRYSLDTLSLDYSLSILSLDTLSQVLSSFVASFFSTQPTPVLLVERVFRKYTKARRHRAAESKTRERVLLKLFAMLKIHRYVPVDRGVEALLDHAILEGEARFAFGVLIGRLASPNNNSSNNNHSNNSNLNAASSNSGGSSSSSSSSDEDWQFHLTHALPVAAGKDTVDPGFLRLLNELLVGGLRVAGLYSIWSTGGAGAVASNAMDRLCQAAFPTLPMVMLEKLEGSHEVKVRFGWGFELWNAHKSATCEGRFDPICHGLALKLCDSLSLVIVIVPAGSTL